MAPAEPFALEGGGRRIEVSLDRGYPYAQVYAPDDDDVIAFEPMTAPTNALVSGRDLKLIEQGESYEATFSDHGFELMSAKPRVEMSNAEFRELFERSRIGAGGEPADERGTLNHLTPNRVAAADRAGEPGRRVKPERPAQHQASTRQSGARGSPHDDAYGRGQRVRRSALPRTTSAWTTTTTPTAISTRSATSTSTELSITAGRATLCHRRGRRGE